MSKKLKLTPLFPLDIAPTRVGVYQHEFTDTATIYFSLWNGEFWCANCRELDKATDITAKSTSAYGPDFAGWRGLAVKP